MTSSKEMLKRFGAVGCEIEGVKISCPDCGIQLQIVPTTPTGMGQNATLPMMYCKTCDSYFITWREEDED